MVAVAALAAAAKIYCAATTFGSGDVMVISRFGALLREHGLAYLYQNTRLFNHPPLAGAFFRFAYGIALGISPMGDHHVPSALPFLIRFPSIVADLVTVFILLKLHVRGQGPPLLGLLVFAASPAAFMTSGFHGNVDAMLVCAVVLAAYFCVAEQPSLSAVALGIACSIKVIALLVAPVFLFYWAMQGRKRRVIFAVTFLLTCLIGWSPALIVSPSLFLRNVLLYPSFAGAWGFTLLVGYFLQPSGAHAAPIDPKAQLAQLAPLLTTLKLLVISGSLAIAWMRRKSPAIGMFSTCAFCWLLFIVFAPGFVPYYLIWVAPFLLVESAVHYVILTLATTVYLFAYYNGMAGGMPWNYADLGARPIWVAWGLVPWITAIAVATGIGVHRYGIGRSESATR